MNFMTFLVGIEIKNIDTSKFYSEKKRIYVCHKTLTLMHTF